MNLWFVAYCRPMLLDRDRRDIRNPQLLYLLDEGREFSNKDRKYSCLVKWKPDPGDFPRLSVRDLRFNPFQEGRAVFMDDKRDDRHEAYITEEIEFSVFGQQVIKAGQIVDLATITHQFSDMRHLFRLPNLTPSFERNLPELKPKGDLWFGEWELLKSPDVRRGALSRPVLLNMAHENGRYVPRADLEHTIIADAFRQSGYTLVPERAPASPGEFRFDPASNDFVDVYLIPNVYSYSFLGLGGDPWLNKQKRSSRLIFFVASGTSGRQGLTLRTAVDILRTQAKAHDALLIDQGEDVFQYANEAWRVLPPDRSRLRSVFIVARKSPPERSGAGMGC